MRKELLHRKLAFDLIKVYHQEEANKMARSATKAADNVFYIARKAAEKFNDRLGSREGAEEETGIERTRLARIEGGVLNPYPEEVVMMARAYNAPELCNFFCSRLCPLGQNTITPCELLQIDRLAVTIIDAMRNAGAAGDAILDVAGDGKVTPDEIPRLEEVARRLETMERASMELRIWIAKHIRRET